MFKYKVPEIAEYYLNSLIDDNKSEDTIKTYNHQLYQFFNIVNKDIKDISVDDIRQYQASIRNLASSSRSQKIVILKSFFKFLHDNKFISINPTETIKPAKVVKELPVYLTQDEAIKFKSAVLDKNNKRDIAIITFMVNLGLRKTEVINLQVKDISDNKLTVNGKGSKQRILTLNEVCLDVINNYLEIRPISKYNNLFLNNYNKFSPMPLTGTIIDYMVHEYCKLAELTYKNIHPHSLRHTFATLSLANGVDIRVIQKRMGHENITTTTIYTSVLNSEEEKASKAFQI